MMQSVMKVALASLIALLPSVLFADELVLAHQQQPRYEIYCETEDPVLDFAADELCRYLTRISGADFNISDSKTDTCIVLKTQNKTQDRRPFADNDGYKIFAEGPTIFIEGKTPRAVLTGTYAFLRGLGCEWIAPDLDFFAGRHEHIPRIDKLAFKGDTCESRADLKYRKIYVEEGRSHNIGNLIKIIDWMGKTGMNVFVCPLDYQGTGRVAWDKWRNVLIPELTKRGIVKEIGGHGYQNFLKASQWFETHPEWFGLRKGKRTNNVHQIFCTSNEEAMAELHKNLIQYLSDHPEIDIFDLWPPDGARWCECPACEDLGNPVQRHARVVKETQQVLKEKFPDLTVEFLAYADYIAPPATTLPDTMLLDFAPNARNYQHPIYSEKSDVNQDYYKNLKKWLQVYEGDISIYSYYRKYAWMSRPLILPRFIQDELSHYHQLGVKGISTYAEPADWFTYGLNHYSLGKLAWDVDADLDQTVNKYCQICYQDGANEAKQIYSVLDRTARAAGSIPHNTVLENSTYEQALDQLQRTHEKLRSKSPSDDSVTRVHLEKLDLLLGYAIMDIQISQQQALGKSLEEQQPQRDEIRKLMLEYPNNGIFLVHFRLDPWWLSRFYKLEKR